MKVKELKKYLELVDDDVEVCMMYYDVPENEYVFLKSNCIVIDEITLNIGVMHELK